MVPATSKRNWHDAEKDIKLRRKKWKKIKIMKKLGIKDASDDDDEQIADDKVQTTGNKVNNSTSRQQNPSDTQLVEKVLRTVSIAVPGSILENAQSFELRSYLAGQIARAACIYNIDEIIVFDDKEKTYDNAIKLQDIRSKACLQLGRILQYLECPQYLRKYIFPIHKDLEYAGLLNPLDAPHHLRREDEFPFREGIVLNLPIKRGKGSCVNVGLHRHVLVDKVLTPQLRVTVKILPETETSKKIRGIIVPPTQPKLELGINWGYSVRLADSLSKVFTDSPYKEGYDLTIGTSDKGKCIDDLVGESSPSFNKDYKHCLIIFGGIDGLESAVEADDDVSVDDIALLFDLYLNTCPKQGSRTIRTEEAILITLAELRKILN